MYFKYKIPLLSYTLLSLFWLFPVDGKDFGIQGELFPIEEENLILFLQKQLSSKIYAVTHLPFSTLQEDLTRQIQLKDVPPEAHVGRTFYYDPTFTVNEPISDHHGTIIVPQGTRINPLRETTLSSGLLFFDGTNPSHIAWAQNQKGDFKWILVRGNPFELEQQEKRPVYFDQKRFSLSKFQIQNIPARVTQEVLLLKIEEIALKEMVSS